MLFEANQALFWSLYKHTSGQKEAKLPKTLFTGQAPHWLFFLMLTYSFQCSGMEKKAKYHDRVCREMSNFPSLSLFPWLLLPLYVTFFSRWSLRFQVSSLHAINEHLIEQL